MAASTPLVLIKAKNEPSARSKQSQHVLELTDERAGYERRLRKIRRLANQNTTSHSRKHWEERVYEQLDSQNNVSEEQGRPWNLGTPAQ